MRSKLAKIFAVIVTLILTIQISLLMKSPAEFKDQTFFEAEKALRETLPIKLEVGDYVGEFDQAGKPANGVLEVKKCAFLPNGIFVGKFGQDGLPFEGELRTPGYSIKLKTLEDGSHHLTQRSFEGGKVTEFEYHDGRWKTLKTTAINGDLLSSDGDVIVKFNEEEISTKEAVLSSMIEVDQKFLPVKQAFESLREKQQQKFAEYQKALVDEGDVVTSQKLQEVKNDLRAREMLRGGTMFAELTGVRNEEDQQRYAIVERGVGIKRNLTKPKETELPSTEELRKFGNCREYGAQTQKIAIEQNLPNTFILFGSPDHVFNVAVDGDRMTLIDGWNGDLVYDFSPKEFYQNQSLHAIFDLKIHKDTWFDAEKNPQGLLHIDNPSTIGAKELLEKRIAEINEARFDPEIGEIIRGRVEEKLERLDPNDAYYHENALELKHIINHFGLSSNLVDKMRDDYVTKFNPDKLIVGNEAYVIYDLFCRDALNPREEFQKISKEFLPKIEQSEAAESNRGKALIAGFGKVLDMEFAEEKEFKESKKPQISLDALDLATLQKPSPSPEKSYAEKMVGISKSGAHEI